jgi:polysaccharide deacetylase 2 family uncharacterized protein YibQ
VYNREEWKKLLRAARNCHILHMPMEWMNRQNKGEGQKIRRKVRKEHSERLTLYRPVLLSDNIQL